ncbi:ATP-dependent nuclease [Flavobacterium sp. 25HG05S-40]|uniref:ATP-dependent nuclease n=1 Tax=Flavobacterium sp. 25HG05S-40 TaxID=3458682 RepID=UPI004043EFEB
MILKKTIIKNFRGINGTITVDFDLFSCIVGQNDAGKSTILKALDAGLNGTALSRTDYNVEAQDNVISVEMHFDCLNSQYTLGEEIETSIEAEELVNDQNLLVWKKTWTVTDTSISTAKTSFIRKVYAGNNDFILKTEAQLMALCGANGIVTAKGNGDNFNNVEKREKLREYNQQNNIAFTYEFEDVPSSGTTKLKSIADSIKKLLPSFQYFKADSSLSDTDTTIQKYFKDMAFNLIQAGINTDDLETQIRNQLGTVLQKVTDKINDVVKSSEKVEPRIEFDWSKLISTSFVSTSSGNNIPLSSRGDGFRRITMMSYFEYLAETNRANSEQQIIFGFEEPETFLHPSAQDNLYDKLNMLTQNGYQVITSTHSPTIVGKTNIQNIVHISKPNNVYTVNQAGLDYKQLAIDLGIKPDNTFTPLFSTSRLLFLVEGIDDVNAMHHKAKLYKQAGEINQTFEELSVNIIPIGGCGGVKHWVNLDLFTKLEKPFFIFLDSDKDNAAQVSPNETSLVNYGLTLGTDFLITKKRLLENYIHPSALHRLVPGSTITYTDFDHAKNLCKDFPDSVIRAHLGGGKVAEKHYGNLTFAELKLTWFDGNTDEFLDLYNIIAAKLN